MNYTIELSVKAEIELYDAWSWYEDEQEGLGVRFEQEFLKKVDSIQLNPLKYPLKKRLREATFNKFPYLIIYRVKGDHIIIASVFHTSRHPKRKIQ